MKAELQPQCVLRDLGGRGAGGGGGGGCRRGSSFQRWLTLPSAEPACLHQPRHAQENGHIQNQTHFHFLEKTILLVISLDLKYFSIIITKGAKGLQTGSEM